LKKISSIQINIPKPCNQEWNEMAPTGEGRFCLHCQKNVIDFTSYSDSALYDFFSKNDRHKVCGRFLLTQVNRSVHVPYQPQSKLYRIAIVLGLTLMFTQVPAQAKLKPPFTVQIAQTTEFTGIEGQVLDNNQKPIVQAVVQAIAGNIVKGGAVTDINGNYEIELPAGSYYVEAMAMNYVNSTINQVIISPDKYTTVNINLNVDTNRNAATPSIKVYKVPFTNKHDHNLSTVTGSTDIDSYEERSRRTLILWQYMNGVRPYNNLIIK
jgi:hypothetical protein